MEYRILGPLEVLNGNPVDLGGHKQRSVLAILLLEAGRTVSTDAIIDRLWGDQVPMTAQGTLQAYVSNLRKALEPRRSTREGPSILVTRPGGYALQVGEGELDAERFEQLAREGADLLVKGNFAGARQSLAAGLALWRGSALADFAFDAFASEQIARLEELRMSALEDRIEADVALGHHGMLVAELRQLVERYPLRERLRGQLMLALYREARQAEALEIYQEGRVRLADELGIDPGPDLRRLHEAILRQDAQLDWRTPRRSSAATSVAGPLLGRDADLDVLLSAAESARSGWGRLVIVAGDAGIGKTRLADEFTSELHGFEVVWGRCHDVGGAPPLWPWLNVFKSLAAERSPQELLEPAGPEASDLIHVVPDLVVADPSLQPTQNADSEDARFRLYVAVTAFLMRAAHERPLAVVLDDLQWADLASLHLVNFLANELHHSRILVLATYRDRDVESQPLLSQTLASLARLPVVERLLLGGLELDHVAAYVNSVAGYEPPRSSVQVIHERTAGNPFFVAELVRLLDSTGDLEGTDEPGAVPANIRDVILRRVSDLPDKTARVLTAAAVMGRDFDLEVVGRIERMNQDAVLDAIEPAVMSRIVVSASPSSGYRFTHGLVGETLYENLTSTARARLHYRVSEALEDIYGGDGDRVSDIAHHLFEAIGVAPVDKIVDYAIRAADRAVVHVAYEQAEEQVRGALKLVERIPESSDRERRELAGQDRLSGLLMMTRGYATPELATSLGRARDLARNLNDHRQLLPALWRLAAFHIVRADMEIALGLAAELDEAASGLADANWQCAAHQVRGIASLHKGDLKVAREHLEQALSLTQSGDTSVLASIIPERDTVVSTLGFLAWAQWLLGDEARAEELAAEQLARARRLDHPYGVAFALLFGALLGSMSCDTPLARERSEELVALAKEHGFRLHQSLGEIYLGSATARVGDVEDGTRQLVAGLAAFEATGARMLASLHYSLLADAHLRAGQWQDALAAIEAGLDRVELTGERFFEAELHRIRGELLHHLFPDDVATAKACLERALTVSRTQEAHSLERRTETSVVQLALVGVDKASPRDPRGSS